MIKTKKELIIVNFVWRFLERIGAQIVSLVVSIILARYIAPSSYGEIALVTVFLGIVQTFVDSGLGNALIQKKNADDLDFSSVFICNMIFCCVLYVIMFFLAPIIANFYKDNIYVPVIRVLGLIIILSGLKNVQQAYVSKNMMFQKFFFSTLGGTIGAAIVGIYMAMNGFGIWALVAQQLFNTIVDTFILWITVKWRPKLLFSFTRLKSLFSFGVKLLLADVVDKIYINLRQLLIGKLYTTESLAYYNRGEHFPKLIIMNVNTSIDSVLLPSLSQEQDDAERVRHMTSFAVKVSTYIMFPLLVIIAVGAEQIVSIILTEKWLPCVPYLRIFCFTYAFVPIHTTNLSAMKAMGRSDLFLKLEIVKKIGGVLILLFTIQEGATVIAYGVALETFFCALINMLPNKKLINYGIRHQIKDILPNMLLTACTGVIVAFAASIQLDRLFSIIFQGIVGITFYIILSAITKNENWIFFQRLLIDEKSKLMGKNRK